MAFNAKYNIWEHSSFVRELYTQRVKDEAEEMTCARQCAEILQPLARSGMSVLDAGCGSGYYYLSFKKRRIDVEYYGIDYAESLIEIGRRHLPAAGLPAARLSIEAIENIDTEYDIVVCFNVLAWVPHYHQALERLCQASRRYLLIRTPLDAETLIRYEEDGYLEEGYNHLKAYWNIYALDEFKKFIESYGFQVRQVRDERTNDGVEMVVGKPFPWKILLGERIAQGS